MILKTNPPRDKLSLPHPADSDTSPSLRSKFNRPLDSSLRVHNKNLTFYQKVLCVIFHHFRISPKIWKKASQITISVQHLGFLSLVHS